MVAGKNFPAVDGYEQFAPLAGSRPTLDQLKPRRPVIAPGELLSHWKNAVDPDHRVLHLLHRHSWTRSLPERLLAV